MRNNNTPIINKLIRRALTADKKRNLFIAAAIALTTLMIATVFSIGISFFESVNMHGKRMEGSISQMAFANPTAEQLAKLSTLDYVKTVGIGAYVAETNDVPKLENLQIGFVDQTQWDQMFCPTFTNIVGHYALGENEVMLSRYILDAMGITEPKIGMEIPLSFTVYGTDAAIRKVFTLSCIYTEYAHSRHSGFVVIYVSEALAEKYGRTGVDNLMVNIIFKDANANHISQYIEKLKTDLAFPSDQRYVQSPAFNQARGNGTTYLAILAIIAFLMLTGYLLIYNTMYISVSRDVRFYGMLKTLGTTPEQIQRIVIGQILCLCGVALPIGCLLAAAISLAVVPAVISNSGIDTGPVISFSPLIFIGAATFAALTALLGAITPARKAAQIAPIEALKFTAEYSNKTQYRSSANGKPYKMAFRNIFRNRKRAVIVMLSLFSSTTVFSSIMAIVSSIDVDYLINMEHDYDYILGTKIFEIDHGYSRGMSGDLISTIKSLPGIIETGMTTLEFGELIYSENLAKYVDWLSRTESMSKEYIITRLLGCGFRGIDPLQLRTINKTLLTPIDEEAFERGEFALLNSANANQERFIAMADSLSDVAAFDIKCGGKLGTFQIINGGSVFYRERNINLHYALGGPEFLVSNSFLRKYFPVPGVVYFAMNVEDALDEQIYHEINTLTSPTNVEINSRYAARQAMQDSKTIMMVLGTGVSLILGLIGVLNFVNVMSVSIMTRKREFAALESVGMSKNQMHRMLKNEGAGYAIIVILCAITVGNLIAYGLFILFRNMAEYARFTYPLIPVLIMYAVIIAICLITPGLIYRGISRMTLAERLREAE